MAHQSRSRPRLGTREDGRRSVAGEAEPTVKAEREYLTPGDVARMLHVSPKTVVRWTTAGHLSCIVTLGGHRRFQRADVEALAARMAVVPEEPSEH